MSFHVSLIGRRNLRAEIYRQLRQAIVDAQLRPGDALPATRELARQLSVSRNTIEVVYDRLAGEGFLTTRVGSGTYVSDDAGALRDKRPRARERGVLRARHVWDDVTPSTAFAEPARFDF